MDLQNNLKIMTITNEKQEKVDEGEQLRYNRPYWTNMAIFALKGYVSHDLIITIKKKKNLPVVHLTSGLHAATFLYYLKKKLQKNWSKELS